MFNIEEFNQEKRRIALASLRNEPVDFSKLRKIYSSLIIVDKEFSYDPSENDENFWKRCLAFSRHLFAQT